MHMLKYILERVIKIKDYLSKINNPVKTANKANKYSMRYLD
tara:strand:- start:226 stop:348 length:123 start_codon:yes stop_codon:yes gene_type:complete